MGWFIRGGGAGATRHNTRPNRPAVSTRANLHAGPPPQCAGERGFGRLTVSWPREHRSSNRCLRYHLRHPSFHGYTRRKTSKCPIHDTWDFLAFFSAIIFLPWTSASAGPSAYPPRKVDCTRICWLADHTHKETRTLSFPEEIILRMHITQ